MATKKGRNVKGEKQTIKASDVAKVKASDPTGEQPAAQESKPKVIKVLKTDAKFRGAREAWYNRLKEYDGKTVDEYVESCKKACPQLTKNQTAENPLGWVSFFRREGILQEVQQ